MALLIAVGYWKHASASKGFAGKSPSGAAQDRGDKSVEAQLFEVRKDRLPDAIDGLIGTIKGNTIELTFNGQEERLTAVHVEVGQRVKKGEVLFELDHLRSASRKSQAESSLARAKELQEVGGDTQHDVDEAQAVFNLAEKDYDDTFIYAPQSGIVSQINRQLGESVNRSDVVAVLVSSNENFYLETGVIEGQIEQVREGQRAVVEIEAFGSAPLEGRVRGVSSEVTTTGRTGTVLVSLPSEVQSKLRPGMSARCKIYVFDEQTYAIPRTAYDAEKQGLFVVGQDKKAHFLKVALGHVTRDYYEIKEGLHDGDRIVNDLTAAPMEENAEVVSVGDAVHYKNPEAAPEKAQ
jgi:RND family efflux transporter MFP subunit